jgi:predicted nuclease with TOPRIM domain
MSFPTEAERQARLHKRAGCDCTEGETMSKIDLDEVSKFAEECERTLSLPGLHSLVTQLADELEHLRSKYTASQEEMTELLTEHRKLGEALDARHNEIARLSKTVIDLRQERQDNFDEIRERF